MSLATSVIGLCATVEYGLSPYPSQGSSDCTLLALCWISGPGASWWRLVAWRVVMARKVVSVILGRLARASCSFCQVLVPFDLFCFQALKMVTCCIYPPGLRHWFAEGCWASYFKYLKLKRL